MISLSEVLEILENFSLSVHKESRTIEDFNESVDSLSIMHLVVIIEEKTSYLFQIEDLANFRKLDDVLEVLRRDHILTP